MRCRIVLQTPSDKEYKKRSRSRGAHESNRRFKERKRYHCITRTVVLVGLQI